MEIRKVNQRLGMSGNDIQFENEILFGLVPGTKIIQIGDGRENGTIRTDCFDFPVTYRGSLMVQFEKLEKMYAFQLECQVDDEDIYLLYGSTEYEIFTEAGNKTNNKGRMRFYAPVFTEFNN